MGGIDLSGSPLFYGLGAESDSEKKYIFDRNLLN